MEEEGRRLMREKRHKLQLFYEILCIIDENTIHNDTIRPTHIQHHSRLAYDKLMNHLNELERIRMIYRQSGGLISIIPRDREFTKRYNELTNLIQINSN